MRRQRRVDLARHQHPAQAFVDRGRVFDPGREIELHLLQPAWLIDAGLHPFDRREVDAVLVLQQAARIDRRGLRPFRNADPLALEVGRLLHAAIFPDIDRGVAAHPRRKHRNADERRVALRGERREFPHRDFGRIEVAMIKHAIENFLNLQVERRQIDALDRHAAGYQLSDVIVVADRQRQRNSAHARSRRSRPGRPAGDGASPRRDWSSRHPCRRPSPRCA